MQDEFDDVLKVEVLTNMLRMGKVESNELVESLASRLQALLPEITKVERGGWILSERKVKRLTVTFSDNQLVLTKDKFGISPTATKIVRGVALKTTELSLDEWIKLLAAELSEAAAHDSNTRQALNNFGLI
ncbi:MAG: hypothetical protein K2X29_01340 [Candidatus Obscuribacterales bacterium]|nr:hypothetical protein [Candidatus Obscuribacterales bacterium]